MGPYNVAKKLAEYIPDKKDRANFKVLDVAAGTGAVGLYMRSQGFKNLDAVGK